jgi:hypothetical protein
MVQPDGPTGRTIRGVAASRLFTPGGLVLALICFLFGFLAVSCETPGGYGRTGQGGTTTYTGLDLATGTTPSIDFDRLDPALADRPDQLPVQPLIILSALAIMVGVVAGASPHPRRRLIVVSATGSALVLLIPGEVVAYQQLLDRVEQQVRQPLPPDKTPADFVAIGGGFTTALLILTVVLVCYLIGYLRRRRTSRAAAG